MAVQTRRRGNRARTRTMTDRGEATEAPSRATGAVTGLVPQALNTVAVLSVGTVRLAETLLTTTLRGVVNVAVEAVDGVRTIGSDVFNGASSTGAREPGRPRREAREREAA